MSTVDRFMQYVSPEPNSGCWLWTGAENRKGYGDFLLHKGKKVITHRFSYELFNGKIPEGLQIDHKCRTRCCVNPNHLEAVTLQENVARGNVGLPQKSRTHCPQGHPYDEANTIRKGNERQCRECNRADSRRRNRKRREAKQI